MSCHINLNTKVLKLCGVISYQSVNPQIMHDTFLTDVSMFLAKSCVRSSLDVPSQAAYDVSSRQRLIRIIRPAAIQERHEAEMYFFEA